MHQCNKESDIDLIKKELFGNGKPGMKESFIRMDENIKALTDTSHNLATAVSGLTKFMNETEGQKSTQRWLIGIILTITTFFGGTIITLLIKLL